MNKLVKKYQFELLLFAIVIAGILPVSSFTAALKFDMIDISLPWRFFIGECIQNGELPKWNPFINFGFPQISEPQTWYPIALFFQLLGRYTLFDLHLEFVFHFLIAAFGVFHFLKAKGKGNLVALAIAVIYVFGGFMVGNAQHLGWIISAAWLPWIWLHFLKILKKQTFSSFLLLPVLLYFMLTGGYPAFFVTNGYIMVGYFLVWVWQHNGLKKPSVFIGLFAVTIVFGVLSFGVISSFYEIKYLITRGSTLTWEALGIGSLSIPSFVSAVAPLLVTTKAEMWGVLDYGLTNLFFGFGVLSVFVFGVLKFNWGWGWKMVLGLFFLWMALGPEFLLLKLVAKTVPFTDVFRFPALYRLFIIFFWLWATADVLHQLDYSRFKKFLKFIPLFFLALTAFSFVWMHKASFWDGFPLPEGYKVWTVSQRAFIWFLGLTIVSGLSWLITKRAEAKNFLLAFIIFEGLWHVTVYGPVSVYYWETTQTAEQYLSKVSKGFPTNNFNEPTANFLEGEIPQTSFLWRNKAHYTKQLGSDGYSPYVFFNFYELSNSPDWEKALGSPYVFLKSNEEQVEMTSFSPAKFQFSFNTTKPDTLVFQQNFLAGWEATINNEEVKIEPYLQAFMQVRVPDGKNLVVFEYKPNFNKHFFFFPLVFCAALMAAGGYFMYSKKGTTAQ